MKSISIKICYTVERLSKCLPNVWELSVIFDVNICVSTKFRKDCVPNFSGCRVSAMEYGNAVQLKPVWELYEIHSKLQCIPQEKRRCLRRYKVRFSLSIVKSLSLVVKCIIVNGTSFSTITNKFFARESSSAYFELGKIRKWLREPALWIQNVHCYSSIPFNISLIFFFIYKQIIRIVFRCKFHLSGDPFWTVFMES